MKFCPYCGASLMGGAVSFCAECGKHLPTRESKPPKPPAAEQSRDVKRSMTAKKRPPSKPAAAKRTMQRKSKVKQSPRMRRKKPLDSNYDGYYSDVKPVDAGQMGERMDPELVKRIVMLIAGAVGVIILSAVLMTLL